MYDFFWGSGGKLICVVLCRRKMNLLKEGHLLLVVGRRVMKPKDLGRCVVHIDRVDIVVYESGILRWQF